MNDSDPFDWARMRPRPPGEPLELTDAVPAPRSPRARNAVPLQRPRPAPEPVPAPPPAPAPGPPIGRQAPEPRPVPAPTPPPSPTAPAPAPQQRSFFEPRLAPPPPPAPAPPPEPLPAPGTYTTNLPVAYRPSPWRWVSRTVAGGIVLFVVAVAWLAVTAPLSKSLEPPAPPSITLLSADGKPVARRGAIIGDPVDAAALPKHVTDAFIAIEDRRFRGHWGIDPRGITRAMLHNLRGDGGMQGGSTITQQLAKNAFLDLDRTATRKFQEVLIAFWLEAWLTKDEILSRYLSNVYFGDNVYGLHAAARHYFSTTPEQLTISQATLLAGLVQAPSRLAPTGNLPGARARQALVIDAMAQTGAITPAIAASVAPAVLKPDRVRQLPNGTYFADWVLPQARDRAGEIATEQRVRTTLETRLQRAAERAVRRVALGKAQVALVAMRNDGSVVAMVGGKSYAASPFNRATQARRQPGSTFKLFVYLAALRAGMTPDSTVEDTPVTIGGWKPENSDGRYRGTITLREAFARSSNVAAARLIRQVGPQNVIRAARDLGISTPIADEASIALGTSTVSLLELTAAYAAVAAGEAPVRPRGLPDTRQDSWLAAAGGRPLGRREAAGLRALLAASVREGTGRAAALSVDAWGKTGTTQNARDVLFIGFAGDLTVGVWVGNDDNSPTPLSSSVPARIWRDFMTSALGVTAWRPAAPEPEPEAVPGDLIDGIVNGLGAELPRVEIERAPDQARDTPGFELKIGPRGDIRIVDPQEPAPRRPRREDARPPDDF